MVGCVLWLINPCRLFNGKSCSYIHTGYIWFVNAEFVGNSFLMSPSIFVCTLLNGFKYCYLTLVIQFNINGLKSSKWSYISILPIHGVITGIFTLGQRGTGSNGNEVIFHIFQCLTIRWFLCLIQNTPWLGNLTPLLRFIWNILQSQLTRQMKKEQIIWKMFT